MRKHVVDGQELKPLQRCAKSVSLVAYNSHKVPSALSIHTAECKVQCSSDRHPKLKKNPKRTRGSRLTFNGASTVLYGLLPAFVLPSVITISTLGLSLRSPPALVNSWLLASSIATSVRVYPEVYGMQFISLS